MLLAVNGALMRGLPLNRNMISAGASFVREERTAPIYRLWSIGDKYPGMMRVTEGGAPISLELWEVAERGLVQILEQEPPGLTVGKMVLENDNTVLGVLAEAYVVQNCKDITNYGGWRAYIGGNL